MARTDEAGMLARMRAHLPRDWFPDDAPALDAVLAAPAWALAWAHSLHLWARRQLRLQTASGSWLDAWAADFLGARVRRRKGQGDESFRRRVGVELFRERATRAGLFGVLLDLTGRPPDIFEPARIGDTGAWGVARTMGYGTAGRYGSRLHPGQAFITALRPLDLGVPYAGGYGLPAAGYRIGGTQWAGATASADAVTDADITEAIAASLPAGTVAWTRILA